jgi:hypothetical protein
MWATRPLYKPRMGVNADFHRLRFYVRNWWARLGAQKWHVVYGSYRAEERFDSCLSLTGTERELHTATVAMLEDLACLEMGAKKESGCRHPLHLSPSVASRKV